MKIKFRNLYRKNEDELIDEWFIGPTSCNRPRTGDHMVFNNKTYEVRTITWHDQESIDIDLMPLD